MSADPNRTLIGDDEHGWSDTAVFNFEGGCYAKMIRLSAEAEPEIFATTKRFGTVLENVVMDPETRELDFDDASLAENSRGAYPIDFIPNSSEENMGPLPKNIVMLTADAFGVLPPIARLTPDQAMYHFLSGYTAKVAGTEIGVTEPEATFSTCFGAPFMPRHPSVYGNLLKERIAKGGVDCWLVNTGWTGGKYGVGKRMPIKATRALLNAALDGSLNNAEFRKDPNFGFEVPVAVPGVDTRILDPRSTWADKDEYDRTAAKLVDLFVDNFAEFAEHVDEGVRQAAPAGPSATSASAAPSHARLTCPVTDRACQGPDQMTDYSPTTVHYRRRDRADRRRPARAHPAARRLDPRSASRRDDLSAAPAPGHRPRRAAAGHHPRLQRERRRREQRHGGYHETITRVFLHGVRLFLAEADAASRCTSWSTTAAVADGQARLAAALLLAGAAVLGRARRGFVRPDLRALP